MTVLPVIAQDHAPSNRLLTPNILVELTKSNNGTVVSARLSQREAEGRLTSARGAGLPTVSLDSRMSWIANPTDAVTLAAGSFAQLPTALPSTDMTIMDAQDPFYYSAALSVDQALWTWGKVSAAVETRDRERLMAGADADRAEASALADLYRSLYALAYQQEALSIVNSQGELSERMLASVASSRVAGVVTDLEYEDASLNAERISRSRASLEDSVRKLKRSVLLLAGIDPDGDYEISVEGLSETPAVPEATAAEWSARARSGNLDLAYAERGVDVRASAADLARKQASGRPDVGLNVRAGWNGSRLPGDDDWSDKGDWFATFTVAVKGSLLDFGASAGKIAEAEFAAARAVSDWESAVKSVDTAVGASLEALDTLRDEAEYCSRLAAFQEAKVIDAESRRSAGAGTELSVLEAQSDWLSAVLDSTGAMMQYTDACVSFLLLADPAEILSGTPFGITSSPFVR